MVDAAFPPSANLWVSDMDAIGAVGGCVYVLGPFTNYSPIHVTLARSHDKVVVPIVVPGNSPPSYAQVWAALLNYQFSSGPVVVDLENGSEPADAWVTGLRTYLSAMGYSIERYGTSTELGKYSPEDEDWIASWIRRGVLDPIPTLPNGWHAWQFVDDVIVNGRQYDVSVMDDLFLQGVDMAITDDILSVVKDIQQHITATDAAQDDAGTPIPDHWAIGYTLTHARSADKALQELKTGGPIDVTALAAALSADASLIHAIAVAVAKEIGSTLTGAQ